MFPALLPSRSPWNPIEALEDESNRLMGHFRRLWGNGHTEADLTAAYPVDIREDDKSIYVDAEMPGFKREEINVTLEEGVLSITAERKTEEEKKDQKSHLHERCYTRVERSFRMPTAIEAGKVAAELKDGVLHVTLQKPVQSVSQKIAIK